MTGELNGRAAIVTGAASGIGRAAALSLARLGAAVAVIDRDAARAEEAAQECRKLSGNALALTLDLTETARIPGAVEEVLGRLGRIDILVNCAGMTGHIHTLLEMDEATWDLVHALNLKAPMLLMKRVAQHMIERGGGGRIVNVTSSSAFRAKARPAYASSKAALTHLTRCAAAEWGRYDINVNAVAPGVTATPMVQLLGGREVLEREVRSGRLENLLHRVSEPEDVAAAIVFLCLPGSRQITGETLHTSAGAVI